MRFRLGGGARALGGGPARRVRPKTGLGFPSTAQTCVLGFRRVRRVAARPTRHNGTCDNASAKHAAAGNEERQSQTRERASAADAKRRKPKV